MRQWFMGMVASGVIAALAMMLTPPGRVRSVTKMACGVLCALAMLSPALEIDPQALSVSIAAYEQAARRVMEDGEEQAKMLERTYIEQEYGAYILSQAAQKQIPIAQASVSARWDEDSQVWYPWSAELLGPYSDGLSQLITTELGIPAERQSWVREEEGSLEDG